ncbi:putative Nonribosomal peptide synthetase [Aspergillus tanneri]|uniref:Putative Nonribosomal peptide synthetase n=1 Tax=Aspergillus tanneri TaxID=1220188 RepID=A0A5M9MVE9_9EURO|nr:putative Nonribosomal peptide synthetase [Aspergillus tanneri]KAA8651101.1 putative Nonribosomal peptide synthetase [Aspergillus tanneri]
MKTPIAVVGTACRFPGDVASPSQLWELLSNPKDVLRDLDPERLNLSGFHHQHGEHHGATDVPNKSYVLDDDVHHFDAAFFNISAAEAEAMDPQQRLLLETTYEALEAAGYTLKQMRGSSTSVFVGAMTSDYHDIQARDLDTISRWHATGTSPSILSNRVSYFFDLRGPSMTINTACSSSLVALHQAVQSLRNGDCTTAIVGGVNLLLDPETYISHSNLHMLSPTSRCRMWDRDADGYARGEGCAAVVIKTLDQALKDGDDVECIIRQTAVNSDGRSAGITMPNSEAQATLIRQTYERCGLDPVRDRCQYFECHGTGTQAGDPVEAQAIQQTFYPKSVVFSPEDKLYVGSIKTLIGHLEGCAGLAGVMKAILCIKNRTITPNMLFDNLNPNIAPFYDHLSVPTSTMPWPSVAPGCPLRASVNSFGFGGTNAHAIIESYVPHQSQKQVGYCKESMHKKDVMPGPFVFSAHTQDSLYSNIEQIARYVKNNEALDLGDLAWTLAKRTALPFKVSITALSREELVGDLDKVVEEYKANKGSEHIPFPRKYAPEPQWIMGIFTGQGAQWAQMGHDILRVSPIFRKSIERCERALANLRDGPSWSLQVELLADKPSSRLSNPAVSQPITTAIEIAVYDLLCACGISLDAVVGHSSGEIVAAYALDIISAEDAMKIAYYRGLHTKPVQSGGMLAVGLAFPDASELCSQPSFSGKIVVAASNGPASTTLSGDYDTILEAKALLDRKKIFARVLQVDVAYHSHHMVPCSAAYLESLKACNIQVRTPRSGCTWISSVTGSSAILKKDIQRFADIYWVDNMVKPVLFSQALERSISDGQKLGACIEIGPHPALRGPVLDTLKPKVSSGVLYTSLLHRGQNDLKAASTAVGCLWELMSERLDLGQFLQAFGKQPLQLTKGLPAYSWDHRKRYWRESRVSRRYRLGGTQLHPLLGRRSTSELTNEMCWRNILHLEEMPWAQGHKHEGQELLLAAFYFSSLVAAASSAAASQCLALLEVNNFVVIEPLILEEHSHGIEYITTVRFHDKNSEKMSDARLDAEASCHACHSDGSTLTKLCTARLTLYLSEALRDGDDQLPPREKRHRLLAPVDVADLYHSFEQAGISYSGPFRSITSIERSLDQATASASWAADTIISGSLLHPAMLEASFQAMMCAFASPFSKGMWTSFHAKEIRRALVNPNLALKNFSCEIDAFVTAVDKGEIEGDVSLYNPDGNTMVQIEGLVMKSAPQTDTSSDRNMFAHVVWESDPFGYSLVSSYHSLEEEVLARDAADMIALYYFRKTLDEIDPLESARFMPHHQLLYREISRIAVDGKGSEYSIVQPNQSQMSEESILAMVDKSAGIVDLQSIHSLGKALPAILRGEVDPLDMPNGAGILERLSHTDGILSALNRDICCIVKRIVHKHPHMEVLELGAGTGVVTQRILEALDDKYTSYCLSSATPELLNQTVGRLSTQHRNLVFKVIDLTTVVAAECGSDKYDMVIAANPLHATEESTSLFESCRAMLKPGGYFWWQGYDQDAQAWLDMSSVRCDAQLRSTGFSGIDHIFHGSMHPDVGGLSVLVTQAVDDTVVMLREPMNSTGLAPLTETVVFLGGKTLLVSRLLHSIQRILAASGTATAIVRDIDQLDLKGLTKEHSIISLVELDEPFFSRGLFHERLLAFKELVERSKHVLWLTAGHMSSTSVAVGRAMRSKEGDNINLQFLDLSTVENMSPSTVVEVFLRLTWSFVPALTDGQTLWTNEPELHWDGCTLRIPRLVRDHRRNKRYNSRHRELRPTAYPSQKPVLVPAMSQVSASSVHVQVRYSFLLCTDMYLWLGSRVDGKGNVVGISEHISSVVQVRPENVHNLVDGDDLSPDALRATASFSLANLLLKSLSGPILLYEPDELLAAAVEQAREAQHTVYFITSKCTDSKKGWIAVHPHASRRMIERALPRDVSVFVDLSSSCDDHVVTILRNIYSEARIQTVELYRRVLFANLGQLIADTYAQACTRLATLPRVVPEVTSLAETPSNSPSVTCPKVVDWTSLAPIASQSEVLGATTMFSSSGTYWMIDMATPLGLSILTWMARNGARTFVLASRNPRVHEAWLEEMSRLGATVKLLKMDASNKKSVLSAFAKIKEILPPIVGVCYAPLALSDEGFEYTIEDERGLVTSAKINTATYLDELFPEPTLNFFVILTSLVSVIGTPKQAEYHASALFMTGLIQQRRQRGLVGSILALGMVVDAGYFAKQGRKVIQRMMHDGHAPLCESDLHHAFGEVVAAGAPGSQENPEIFIGLQMIDRQIDQDGESSWPSNPLLSHFTTYGARAKQGQSVKQEDSSSILPPEHQPQESEPRQNAYETLLERLSKKVESMLRLPPQTLDVHTPLLDLGCDSLLAVDIQTWFTKELDIYIAPMDALQGTVAGLCEKAIPQPDAQVLVPQKEDQPADEIDFTDLATTASNSEHNSSVQDLSLDIISSESSCVLCPSDSGFEQGQSVIEPRFTRVEKMSPHQSQIWFAGHWMKDPSQYNVVISYNLQGNFMLEKFKGALEQAVSRHESVRTAFFSDPNSGDLLQGVLKMPPPFFEHVTASGAASVSREFDKLASHQWRLEQGEVMRVTVVSVGQDQHTVIFGYHHIVMDGASWSTFLHDLKCFYEGSPPREVAQYVDYSLMLNRDIENGTFAKELEYWKCELSPPPEVMPVLPLAKEKTRAPTDNFKVHTATRHVSIEVADRIKQASRSLRGTPFHFYLATLQVFLAGLLKVENLCIGMSDANRKHQQFIGTVGYFLNMLPLRFHVQQTDSFAQVFQKTSTKVLTAISNSSVPSNLVVDALNIPRASNVTPLFQVAINYRVGEITRMSVDDFDLNYDRSVMGNAPYDMSFHVTPCANGSCIVELNCRDYLYSPQATEWIMDEYIQLLEILSSDPSQSIQGSLSSASPINEDGLSVQRGPRLGHGWPETLSQRFQNMTDQYGDRIAVTDETGEFTYLQLNERSTLIGEAVLQRGVTSGDKVAVLCHPSVSLVASMLAVLHVGAVYVPLDLSLPSARHRAMIEASAVKAIICSSSTAQEASELGVDTVINASEVVGTRVSSMRTFKDVPNGGSLSILLYTSGSTGQPKGVCLPQGGFINYLAAKQKELGLDSSTVVLQQSSLGFDMGLAQTLNAIMNGGKLVIVPQEIRRDSVEIAKIIRDHKISFTLATPSEYLVMLQHGRKYLHDYTGWRHACLGGEPFTDQLKREFARLGANCPVVQDSYGVTEISACTTFETMSASQLEGARSVGRTIANTSLYIVDADCNLVPTGEVGEICVSGAGIALGYLNEEQTRLKFVDDPYALPEDIARGWTRMYRTGDKAQLLEDNSLILLGRMDGNTEIKLRGLRIDLEDVASTMVNCHSNLLSSAIVCVKSQGDSECLVAFVALNPGQTASPAELQHLASNLPLPQYMHPAAVICLNELPRNANGKIDRKQIEAMPWTAPITTAEPAKRLTLDEGELKLLWQNLLPGKQIQPESDFFLLGGNSLLLVKLQGAIRTSIGVSLTLRELYGASTLALMALKVKARKAEAPSTSINWLAETAIPQNILEHVVPTPNTMPPKNYQGSGCEILLTGSTSFLGRVLVQVLVQMPEVHGVHCIAVEKEQEHVLPTSDKISLYYGTLLDPMLGLSTTEWASLQSCIDVVIHGGSNGHCLNTYNSLKSPNLGSTHRLAQFALQSQIPLHYISSGRVILQSGKTSLGPVSVSMHPPPLDGSDGLTATKWASEVFLERFTEQTGANISIHRPCTPIGDKAPASDALNSLLRFSATLGATPRLTRMEGYLDFQKVEIVAEEIATLVTSRFTRPSTPQSFTTSGVSFFHHSSKVKIPVKSFREYMEKVHGRPFQELNLRDWSSLALERGIEPLIPSFLEAVDDNQDTVRYPYLGE